MSGGAHDARIDTARTGTPQVVEHGALTGLTALVAGPHATAAPLAAALRAAGAVTVVVPAPLALGIAAHVRPDVALAVAEEADVGAGSTLADALARDPELYPLVTVLAAPRSALDELGAGPWTTTVGLPTSAAELVSAVRTASQLRRLRDELLGVHRRFERDALTDPLTGRPNRRYIERSLDALVAAARRHGRPLSVVLLDLDRFKAINDEHGHAAGDAILRGVCDRLAGRLRAEDVLGRLGGDELVALLPETGATAGAKVARALTAAVARAPIAIPGGDLDVRATAGHATLREGEEVRELLERADRALYDAKRAGGGTAASADALRAA